MNGPSLFQMQVRFDGYLGFPGGLVDPEDVDIVSGLNRELMEEAGLEDEMKIEQKDHRITEVVHKKSLILHFYIKEVTLAEFCRMERNILQAPEYGYEVSEMCKGVVCQWQLVP